MPSVVQSRSFDSVRIFWLDSEEAIRRLREAASELLRTRSEVLSVLLFGSLREGRAVPGSDADVVVLLERSDRRFMDRPLDYSRSFDRVGLPVDLFCYTREEARTTPFARRALEQATVLAQRDSVRLARTSRSQRRDGVSPQE